MYACPQSGNLPSYRVTMYSHPCVLFAIGSKGRMDLSTDQPFLAPSAIAGFIQSVDRSPDITFAAGLLLGWDLHNFL